MREQIKKNIVWLVISALLVLLIIPTIIYFISTIPLLPSGGNDWAGFWGGYIGAIIGGICTVVGVYWTIQYSQENYHEDVKNRTLPYIALTLLQKERLVDIFSLLEKNTDLQNDSEVVLDKYVEYRLDKVYIVIENGEITYHTHLSKEQELLIKNNGVKSIQSEKKVSLKNVGIISMPMEFENVGSGAAVRFRIGLNKEKAKEPTFSRPINLKISEKIYVHIFSEGNNKEKVNYGKYLLEIYYDDIINNHYSQKYPVEIGKKDNVYSNIEWEGKQNIEKIGC